MSKPVHIPIGQQGNYSPHTAAVDQARELLARAKSSADSDDRQAWLTMAVEQLLEVVGDLARGSA